MSHRSTALPQRPRLKQTIELFHASDGNSYLLRGSGEDLVIEAPSRAVRALLAQLDGTRTLPALAAGEDSVERAVQQLVELGAVEDAADDDALCARTLERHDRQLRYFGDVLAAGSSRATAQARLAGARVVVLGAGGLGSWALYGLACAGVGTLVVADGDRVELSNLNRQILYRERDVGRPKAMAAAEALRAFDSALAISAVCERLEGPHEIGDVIAGADCVLDAADWPVGAIDRWVNEACFAAGIPYLTMSQHPPLARVGPFYVPARTACLECHLQRQRASFPLLEEYLAGGGARSSPAATFGPACGLIGSMAATEIVHHLAGVCEPASLGAELVFDLRAMRISRKPVERWDRCAVCAPMAGRERDCSIP